VSAPSGDDFVLGIDLDGVVADFYGRMREMAAEWFGVPVDSLTTDVDWGMTVWGIRNEDEYLRLHRWAVTQRELFRSMPPMPGAPQALRRLAAEDVRIRIITHRLVIPYFHETAVHQTVSWLDRHGVPYWDLCFMRRKTAVGADVYLDDAPHNIAELQSEHLPLIVFTNSTNADMPAEQHGRAADWHEAEDMIRSRYHRWLRDRGRPVPEQPGVAPPDAIENGNRAS
jgi:5'(3')-deoxyribonucleotidase